MTDYTEVFKEISAIRKGLREPIKHMPKYNRYLVGDDIQKQLLNIKVSVSLVYNYPNRFSYPEEVLIKDLCTLAALLDECIEDSVLAMHGYYNIIEPRRRLTKLIESIIPKTGDTH